MNILIAIFVYMAGCVVTVLDFSLTPRGIQLVAASMAVMVGAGSLVYITHKKGISAFELHSRINQIFFPRRK